MRLQGLYLSSLVNECADFMPEVNRRTRLAWLATVGSSGSVRYGETAPFTFKGRMLQAEVG